MGTIGSGKMSVCFTLSLHNQMPRWWSKSSLAGKCSTYFHQTLYWTADSGTDTNRSAVSEPMKYEKDPSICMQSRWPPSPEVRSSLLSRPHSEAGALRNCIFWPAAWCIPGWAAWDTSDRPTTITTAVSREHLVFINAAYTQVYRLPSDILDVASWRATSKQLLNAFT